jgi:hypothetical protein
MFRLYTRIYGIVHGFETHLSYVSIDLHQTISCWIPFQQDTIWAIEY